MKLRPCLIVLVVCILVLALSFSSVSAKDSWVEYTEEPCWMSVSNEVLKIYNKTYYPEFLYPFRILPFGNLYSYFVIGFDPYVNSLDMNLIKEETERGNLVIVLQRTSLLDFGGHYRLVTGITPDLSQIQFYDYGYWWFDQDFFVEISEPYNKMLVIRRNNQ